MSQQATRPAAASERPLVTVALFAYQQERFIEAAVRGALEQDYPNLEIILSDDGSADATYAHIERLAQSYPGPHRVVTNRNPANLGVGGHVNRIMELASGELIVAASGDDVSHPERVSTLVNAWLARGRPAALSAQARSIDGEGVELEARYTGFDGLGPEPGEAAESCLLGLVRTGRCVVMGCTEAWSAETWRRFGPLREEVTHEDYAVSVRAWLGGRIEYLDDILVDYRLHGGNLCFRTPLRRHDATTVAEWEQVRARQAAGRAADYRQALQDLATARDAGWVDPDFADPLEAELQRLLESKNMQADWWATGPGGRAQLLGGALAAGRAGDLAWGLPRSMPLRIYTSLRGLAGNLAGRVRTLAGS